jgi:hypothetical protein
MLERRREGNLTQYRKRNQGQCVAYEKTLKLLGFLLSTMNESSTKKKKRKKERKKERKEERKKKENIMER